MATIQDLAEQIEAAMPADAHNAEVRCPNGAILQLTRSRVRGIYCDGCSVDVMLYEHAPRCGVAAAERQAAALR